MMRYFLSIAIIMTNMIVFGQIYSMYELTFEANNDGARIVFGSEYGESCSWQIGPPMKEFLSEPYSEPNVIITDTINPYPAKDTSSFYIIHVARSGYEKNYDVRIGGYYKVDSDSLKDYGKIEVSFNKGDSWIDLLSDTLSEDYVVTSQPVLTGRSDWNYFIILMKYELTIDVHTGDTVIFRFSFISDSIAEERDGLMYDNLLFLDASSKIDPAGSNDFHTIVYPNPAIDILYISIEKGDFQKFSIAVYSANGRLVLKQNAITDDLIKIDTKDFSKGIYFYRIVNEQNYKRSIGKFMVK